MSTTRADGVSQRQIRDDQPSTMVKQGVFPAAAHSSKAKRTDLAAQAHSSSKMSDPLPLSVVRRFGPPRRQSYNSARSSAARRPISRYRSLQEEQRRQESADKSEMELNRRRFRGNTLSFRAGWAIDPTVAPVCFSHDQALSTCLGRCELPPT